MMPILSEFYRKLKRFPSQRATIWLTKHRSTCEQSGIGVVLLRVVVAAPAWSTRMVLKEVILVKDLKLQEQALGNIITVNPCGEAKCRQTSSLELFGLQGLLQLEVFKNTCGLEVLCDKLKSHCCYVSNTSWVQQSPQCDQSSMCHSD